ncbi:MAG: 1-acyl-sn-glycerol-3-phosphate acyltransferase [Myxococcales bacterium]|nr:1-acyl-sn-glycerol-3-phosphate acyltransferase [Myxococcales bacterium]
MKRLSRFGRTLGVGLSFAYFSLWGLTLGILVFPWLSLFRKNKRRRRERFMRHMQWSWRVFLRFMMRVRAFHRITVEGDLDAVQSQPCLLIANHITLVDIVALGAYVENFNCIVKESAWRHPFYGSVLRHCEFIPNTTSVSLIEQCTESFAESRPLVIFPSGTRTPPGAPIRFQRGAAQVAVRTGVPIVPVLVTCDPPTLIKGEPWYRVPHRAPTLRLRVQPAMEIPAHIQEEPRIPVRVRLLNQHFENYFAEKLAPPH